MPVRQEYHYNAPTGNNGGLILSQSSDIKGFRTDQVLRWLLDLGATNILDLGDTTAFGGGPVLTKPRGGMGFVTRAVANGAQTVTVDDLYLEANTAAGTTTFNLPALSGVVDGQIFIFKKLSAANNMVLDGSGAETIDGFTTITCPDLNHEIAIIKRATGWQILWGMPLLPTRLF
jgi:hypothetical protein